jgi:AcrR family transcriptional regulator
MKSTILDAFEDRILSQGFRRVTVDEVAKTLGMSKKTIYQHFQSKHQIVEEVINRLLRRTNARINALKRQHKDPVERWRMIVLSVSEQLRRFERPFLDDLRRDTGHLWEKVEAFRRGKLLELEELIREGVKEGKMKNLDPHLVTLIYIGTVNAIMTPQVLVEINYSAEETLTTIFRIFFCGILTDREGKKMEDFLERSNRKR